MLYKNITSQKRVFPEKAKKTRKKSGLSFCFYKSNGGDKISSISLDLEGSKKAKKQMISRPVRNTFCGFLQKNGPIFFLHAQKACFCQLFDGLDH